MVKEISKRMLGIMLLVIQSAAYGMYSKGKNGQNQELVNVSSVIQLLPGDKRKELRAYVEEAIKGRKFNFEIGNEAHDKYFVNLRTANKKKLNDDVITMTFNADLSDKVCIWQGQRYTAATLTDILKCIKDAQ